MPEMTDLEMIMYAVVAAIAGICLLLILHKIQADRQWRKHLYVGIRDIIEYGDVENFYIEEFQRGWAKRKHPDLLIYCPEDWRSSEDRINEALEAMRRDSLISRVEVFFTGKKFVLDISARNW